MLADSTHTRLFDVYATFSPARCNFWWLKCTSAIHDSPFSNSHYTRCRDVVRARRECSAHETDQRFFYWMPNSESLTLVHKSKAAGWQQANWAAGCREILFQVVMSCLLTQIFFFPELQILIMLFQSYTCCLRVQRCHFKRIPDSTHTSRRCLFDVCVYICKSHYLDCLLICNTSLGRFLKDVIDILKMFLIYNVCKALM